MLTFLFSLIGVWLLSGFLALGGMLLWDGAGAKALERLGDHHWVTRSFAALVLPAVVLAALFDRDAIPMVSELWDCVKGKPKAEDE